MRSRALPTKARVGAALLVSVILILAVASSPIHSALAGTKEPPAPKPAKPKGTASTFNFNQYGPSPYDDVVLRWGEEALTAVRATKPGPAVVARSLAVVHTAMYDAWAACAAPRASSRPTTSPWPSAMPPTGCCWTCSQAGPATSRGS